MIPAEQTIAFTRGIPADDSFATDEIADCAAAAIRSPLAVQVLQYGSSLGFAPLREWLAARHDVTPDQILLGNGSLQLVDLMGWGLLEPGDAVFVESPTYDRVITLLRRHRVEVVGIPLTTSGPDLAALDAALGRTTPKFFYTIPDFQNPSGVTATRATRERVVELCTRHGVRIVEDGAYRHLRYRGAQLPAYGEIARDRTLQLSSFTKQVAPGLRVGYLIADAATVARVAKVAEDTYITPNLLGEATVWELCRRGRLEPQHARLRALYAPKLDAALAALRTHLPEAHAVEPEGGFFVSVTLPDGVTNAALRQRAAELGLGLTDGRGFFPNPADGERFLRLPFCALTPEEIEEGFRRLARAVAATRR
ncbi:MAG: PLP-dependent aminotransferase family protein [Candidatus Binatia bacterium]